MQFSVTSTQKALGAFVVSLTGSLDTTAFQQLEERLDSIIDDSTRLIVFDMEHLKYISSAGVRTILKAVKTVNEKNGKVAFLNLQPQVKTVFEIIQALPSQKIFKDIEELDEYLDIMQKKIIEEK